MGKKTKLKKITGAVGSVLHEWQGEVIVLRWRTDGDTIKGGSMTAYVDF